MRDFMLKAGMKAQAHMPMMMLIASFGMVIVTIAGCKV